MVYDYIVIGGGSGGIASARRAASYGKKVAVIERSRLGGTCVNVGCVPKKLFYNAAHISDTIKQSFEYGFHLNSKPISDFEFDWSKFKKKRDAYITRLNGIYKNNLEKDVIEIFCGTAKFKDKKTVEIESVDGNRILVEGKNILIAVGGQPMPLDKKGMDYCITSDQFFELKEQPKSVAVLGSGYIAIELAGVFNALGTKTHIFTRTPKILRAFDSIIGETVKSEMAKEGCLFYPETGVEQIKKLENNKLQFEYFEKATKAIKSIEVDCVLIAIGRIPETKDLGLDKIGLKTNDSGHIEVNEYQETNVENIYALGDVAGKFELTPVAIAAGRKLSDRLFGGPQYKNSKLEYENIPTVTFTHPPTGSIGMTEEEAIKEHGEDRIKIYKSRFVNMFYSMIEEQEKKPPTTMKLICVLPTEKVVGLHLIGRDVDEMLQGFGVAVKMGATKKDFDNCVAIHPTSAEELVTLK